MNRRNFLVALSLVSAGLSVVGGAASGTQDVEYLQALERAQRDRPHALTTSARIASASEPGVPLVIHGRILHADGVTPAAGIIVFAYHTDATGRYNVPSAGPHSWRLRGWATSGADGRFEFTTIRPAPYPGRSVAAHVHVSIDGPAVSRQSAGLMFEGDPLLTAVELEESARAGRFGTVRPVENRNGVQHVVLDIRIGA
jgi:protocatechuate 3,4-dioxygenase beta subunit